MFFNSWCTVTIETLKKPYSEIIIYCQLIENYLKWCYAFMRKGNHIENFKTVEKLPMGKFIVKFRKLDFSDNNPYLNKDDYKYLREMTQKRNFYVHSFFTEFLIAKNNNDSKVLNEIYQTLKNDLKIMENLYKNVCNFYNEILGEYKRDDE